MGRPGKKGGIWVELGVIGGENSRKPVFGFQLSKERLFCKGLRLPFVDKKGSLKTLYRLFVYLLCANKGSLKIF